MNHINQNPESTETVIFLHIHKTAGTTLNRIIDRQYPHEQDFFIKSADDYPLFETFTMEQRNRYRLIRGHMNFGVHKLLSKPFAYFTILRHPIERAISYYYYVKNTPTHYNYEQANRMGLYEFLEQGVDILMANGQTRIWAGGRPDFGYNECTEEVLVQAKDNLDKYCAVVGLTERFDTTLLLLKNRFGWKNVFYTRQNVSVNRLKRHDLPAKTLQLLEELNQLDMAFYQYGVERFEEQIKQQKKTFPIQLKIFQMMNKLVPFALPAYKLWVKGVRRIR